jgi:hypothetical protein
MFRRTVGLIAALLVVVGVGLATMWVREEPRRFPPAPPGPLPPQIWARLRIAQAYWHPPRTDIDLARPAPRLPPYKRCEARQVLNWMYDPDATSVDMNWSAIEAAGTWPETWVPRAAALGGTLGSALADVLTPLGLAFATDGYHVYVSTPADVERLGRPGRLRCDMRSAASGCSSRPRQLLNPRIVTGRGSS